MSEYKIHKGRLMPIERKEQETDYDYIQRVCVILSKDFLDAKWEDDIREYISWHMDEKDGFYVNNKFYENIDHQEFEDDDIQELHGNEVDGYTYLMRFYNGVTCLSEMIEESLNEK